MTEKTCMDPATAAAVDGRRPDFRISCVETAEAAIGKLHQDSRIVAVSKGQWSLLDGIKAILRSTGPAHLMVSTWTAGSRDQEHLKWLLETDQILSCVIMTDRSYKTLKRERCDRIREMFGDDSVVVTFTHAKFALLRNDDWKVTIRGSGNLNRSPRLEQVDIDVSEEFRKTTPLGFDSSNQALWRGFDDALITETCGGEVQLLDGADGETPEELPARVAQLAGLQFTRGQITTMLGLEELGDDLEVAYLRGQLLAEEPIRRTMLAKATSGDPKAVEAFEGLVKKRVKEDRIKPILRP
jgi:hypothetical protein